MFSTQDLQVLQVPKADLSFLKALTLFILFLTSHKLILSLSSIGNCIQECLHCFVVVRLCATNYCCDSCEWVLSREYSVGLRLHV